MAQVVELAGERRGGLRSVARYSKRFRTNSLRCNFRHSQILATIRYSEPRPRRTRLFCDAYGLDQCAGLVDKILQRRTPSMIRTESGDGRLG